MDCIEPNLNNQAKEPNLHFHDCFIQGCDGSILLKDSATFTSGQIALQKFRSARGFNVVDDIKLAVERVCPGVVSYVDILTVASRNASKYVGGPSWTVKLRRRDSKTTSKALVEANLPMAFDDVGALISSFARQGLSAHDMLALSRAYTIRMAQCFTFRGSDTNINAGFFSTRRRSCPAVAGNGDDNLAPLDLVTPSPFDNNYFKNLLRNKGLLHSNQALFNCSSSGMESIVLDYARDQALFYLDFAAAMVKMGRKCYIWSPHVALRADSNPGLTHVQ